MLIKLSGIPILNLLESYDWVDGEIDEYILGAIYEKTMSIDKRKAQGSYYTPEIITKDMSMYTIEKNLINQINKELETQFVTINEMFSGLQVENYPLLFKLLNSITILDPSVGSAHFLEAPLTSFPNLFGIVDKVKRIKESKERKTERNRKNRKNRKNQNQCRI